MKGSPGGLARIDRLFHSQAYTIGFSNAPVVFGAFPSLHSACATIEALFISHFFPECKAYAWTYVIVLYWATMYLTHHYLIDVVGGACFAVACFYFYLPDDLRELSRQSRNKHELYGLSVPTRRAHSPGFDSDLASDDEVDTDIPFRSPRPPITPDSAAPLVKDNGTRSSTAKTHRHTASIASLIGADNQISDVTTISAVPPIGNRGFGKVDNTPTLNNKL
jgi:inositol phosphorylceramide synthase catalytic subunit